MLLNEVVRLARFSGARAVSRDWLLGEERRQRADCRSLP
jgi:hypothetical protein